MAARAVPMIVYARLLELSETGERLREGVFNSQLEQAALAFPESRLATLNGEWLLDFLHRAVNWLASLPCYAINT